MDFMKIIKSLEQLLYELMVWIVFYPLTLWRAIRQPLDLMTYADDELEDAEEDQYSDTLSPPIFLAITLGLVHLFELAANINTVSDGLLADDRNLIGFRLVAFALFPLMLSLRMLRIKGIALDRNALRPPFYAQCFAAAPFALGIDIAAVMFAGGASTVPVIGVLGATLAWYFAVQCAWFAQVLNISWFSALPQVLRAFITALLICFLLGLAISQL